MKKEDKRLLETEVTKEAIKELNLDRSKIKTVLRGSKYKTFYYEEVNSYLYYEVKRPEWKYEKRETRFFQKVKNGEIKLIYLDQERKNNDGEEVDKFESTATIDVEEIAINQLREEAIREVLKKLTADERKIVDLIFYDGLTEREVASIIGVSQKTVNNRKTKILDKLKSELRDYSDFY